MEFVSTEQRVALEEHGQCLHEEGRSQFLRHEHEVVVNVDFTRRAFLVVAFRDEINKVLRLFLDVGVNHVVEREMTVFLQCDLRAQGSVGHHGIFAPRNCGCHAEVERLFFVDLFKHDGGFCFQCFGRNVHFCVAPFEADVGGEIGIEE